MHYVVEYLDRALTFERLAAQEQDPEKRAALLMQARAYHALAQRRAERMGFTLPQPPRPRIDC